MVRRYDKQVKKKFLTKAKQARRRGTTWARVCEIARKYGYQGSTQALVAMMRNEMIRKRGGHGQAQAALDKQFGPPAPFHRQLGSVVRRNRIAHADAPAQDSSVIMGNPRNDDVQLVVRELNERIQQRSNEISKEKVGRFFTRVRELASEMFK